MSLNKTQLGWVRSAAAAAGYEWPVIAALVDKESSGRFGWRVGDHNVPALNIEGHYFYRWLNLLAPDKLKQAVADGLAAKKRGIVKVPGSYAGRYAMFDRMKALHREAAYRSVSVGAGQIMGENYDEMGFGSAEELFEHAAASGENQVVQIVKFIGTKSPLAAAVHEEDVKGIAFYYNGPAYRSNQYDTKLRELIDFYEGRDPIPSETPADEYAERIKALGYESVEQFQRENSLKPDGIVGRITIDKLDEVETVRKKKQAKPAVVTATVAAGTVTVGGTTAVAVDGAQSIGDVIEKVRPVITTVQQAATVSPKLIVVVVAALIVGVVAYVVVQKLRKR